MSVVQRSINDELRAGHLDKTAALRNRQFDQISDASHRGFYRVDFCEQRLFELHHRGPNESAQTSVYSGCSDA